MRCNLRYDRLCSVARVFRWLIMGSMLVITVLSIYSLMTPLTEWTLWPGLIAGIDTGGISADDHNLAQWLSLLPRGAVLYGFYRLVNMMRACEIGNIFSAKVPAHLQGFSAAIVVAEMLKIALPLQVALAHVIAGHPHGDITLIIKGQQLFLLPLALLFMVAAFLLREAARMAEDNAAII